jgi:hypothetical protein
VHLQTRSIASSKCISKLAPSLPRFASPSLLDHSIQEYLQSCSITASKFTRSRPSKCISYLTRSQPPSICLNPLHHGLQVYLQTRSITPSKYISKLATSHPPSVSPNSLDYDIQVHSIMASNYISKLAQSWPWSISLSSPDSHFQAQLKLLSSTSCSQSRYTVCRWVAT